MTHDDIPYVPYPDDTDATEPPYDGAAEPGVLNMSDPQSVRDWFPRIDWPALFADEGGEEWILEPLVAVGRATAIYSVPKLGKSLLALELAVGIARGTAVLGVTPTRAYRVLYVDFENDPRGDIRDRLLDMGVAADQLARLDYLTFPSMDKLDTPAGGAQLLAAVEAYGSELVVIDTVSRSVAGEENSNDTWLSFYRCTGMRLKKARVALLRLDHSGKDETKGQRGGSAKSGDVDAVWRLSRVTRDSETYRLECEAHRMPIAETTLVLHRESEPLRHRVDSLGGIAARLARIAEIVAALDAAGLPADAGRPAALVVLKDRQIKARTVLVAEALRIRKDPLRVVPLRPEQLSDGSSPEQSGNSPPTLPPENGSYLQKDLSPESGNSAGTASERDCSLLLPSRGGNGSGTAPSTPCHYVTCDEAPTDGIFCAKHAKRPTDRKATA